MTSPIQREHLSRKQYQRKLQKRRRRLRKRRRSRVRRVRLWRAVRTTRFWTRVLIASWVLLLFAFWSRFALVYDIPNFARRGPLVGVSAYITVKPWWFGPPLFDLTQFTTYPVHPIFGSNRYAILIQNLGRYKSVIEQPHFIWVQRIH